MRKILIGMVCCFALAAAGCGEKGKAVGHDLKKGSKEVWKDLKDAGKTTAKETKEAVKLKK